MNKDNKTAMAEKRPGTASFRRISNKNTSDYPLRIVYRDEYFSIVAKPAGMPSQTRKNEKDVLFTLAEMIGVSQKQLHLVNRLDQPVFGLMIVAFSGDIHAQFEKLRIADKIEKTYIAVTTGIPKASQGQLINELIRNSRKNISEVIEEANKHSRRAKLRWARLATLETGSGDDLALIMIRLETGRHHQIRVQFANAGWPIWGDRKYGSKAFHNGNIALFSQRLRFFHPITNKEINVSLELPDREPFNRFNQDSIDLIK